MWTILLWLASPSEAIELTIEGYCDEAFTVTVSDATPGRRYALVSSETAGISVITEGSCAGATLGLERSTLALRRFKPSDSAGSDSLTVEGRDSFCGMYTQAMDMASCAVSDVKRLSQQGLIVAEGSGGTPTTNVYNIDLVSGETSLLGASGENLTAMSYDAGGVLWAVNTGWPPSVYTMDPATAELSYVFRSGADGRQPGLTWIDGRLYFYSKSEGAVHEFDPTTGEDLGSVAGSSWGWDVAMCANAEGDLYRFSDTELYLVNLEEEVEEFLCYVSDLPYTAGSACAFHEGEMYTVHGTPWDGRELWHVDPVTCEAESTGIDLPDHADALAGRP
jgi:hypothetical protein